MRSNGRAFKGRRAASVSTGAVVAVTADRTKRCDIGVRSRAPAEDSGQFESITTTVLGQWPSWRIGRGRPGGLRQSSRWEASEMDHSPKGEAVAQPNQWRSWARPTWTGSPKGEHGICEWSRWGPCEIDPRLQAEPVESANQSISAAMISRLVRLTSPYGGWIRASRSKRKATVSDPSESD